MRTSQIALDHTLDHQPLVYRIVHSLLSQAFDVISPSRICQRRGHHVLGMDVFTYEPWDLDKRYHRKLAGKGCRDCGTVVGPYV
ncbi:MAG: hypothetical protein ABI679_09120 [Gemmatimonadota bacterium]